MDGSGNVYIADEYNGVIREVYTSGVIATIAGGGSSLGDGGAAIGRAIGIGDGQALQGGRAKEIEGGRRKLRVFPRPENERASRIGDGDVFVLRIHPIGHHRGVGEARGDEAPGKTEVGGEKDVERGTVFDLRGEHGRGLVCGFGVNSAGALKLREDRRKNGLEIGRGGHAQRGLRAERRDEQETEQGGEESRQHVQPSLR